MPSISKSIKVKNCRSFIAEERVLVQVYKLKNQDRNECKTKS